MNQHDIAIATLIANAIIAACWFFSLREAGISPLDLRQIRLSTRFVFNSSVHLYFLALSCIPYLNDTSSMRLVVVTLACMGFSAATAAPHFLIPQMLQYRSLRYLSLAALSAIGVLVSTSRQPIAFVPMVFSVCVGLFQFQQRLRELTSLADENAALRDKIAILTARQRIQRYAIQPGRYQLPVQTVRIKEATAASDFEQRASS